MGRTHAVPHGGPMTAPVGVSMRPSGQKVKLLNDQ